MPERDREQQAPEHLAWAFGQARRHLELLVRASAVLAPALDDAETAVAALPELVVPQVADWCAVDLTGEHGVRRLASALGSPARRSTEKRLLDANPRWTAAVDDVVRGGEAAIVFDVDRPGRAGWDDHAKVLAGLGMSSYAMVPIRLRGLTYGVLSAATRPDRRGLRPSDVEALGEVAARAALSFERSLLHRQVRRTAMEAEARAEELGRLYAEAEQREQRIAAIVEASPLAIVELGPTGRVEWTNPAAHALFPELPAVLVAELGVLAERARREDRAQDVEISPEENRDLLVSVAPLGAGGAIAVLVDVTRRKRLERALLDAQRQEMQSELARTIAHDFGNLLTRIEGFAGLARRRALQLPDTPRRELVDDLDAITTAADEAVRLSRTLLDVGEETGGAVGRDVWPPQWTDVARVVSEAEPVLASVAGPGARMRLTIDRPAMVAVARDDVEVIVRNLVANAGNAIEPGGTIEVFAGGPTAQRPDLVALRVTDDGAGMDPGVLARCLEPKFTTRAAAGGTGLGLAQVDRLARRAGGRVEIASAPGEGTAVTVLLPAADAPDAGHARPCRVLVVDDDDDVRTYARQALHQAGHIVSGARDAESALNLAEVMGGFDVLVTDLVMPGVGGTELARTFQRLWPSTGIVVVTGFGRAEVEPHWEMLAKPFDVAELDAAVRSVRKRAAG